MSNLYSPDVVGPLYYWMGQVVDDDIWYQNVTPKIHNRDDAPGWGFRYKVRIFGRDVKSKKGVSDEQLDWATVVLPVTAGSGHAGSIQTPNIRQGSYVMGFYEDGLRATKPVIFGTFPNHSQTGLYGGNPEENFVPRSGYKGSEKPIATTNIYKNPVSVAGNYFTGVPFIETPDQHQFSVAHQDQQRDGARCHHIPKTKQCDGPSGEIKGIQRFIKNFIAFVTRVKAESKSFYGAASDLTSGISVFVDDAALFISTLIKSLLDKARGFLVNKLNNGVKNVIDKLPPNLRPGANEANEKATDTLQCAFNKIIKGLVTLVKDLLNQIIDKYINAPMCAVENFVGSLLSSVLGDITSAIQDALQAVQSVLGAIQSITGQIFNALDAIVGVLKFLSCEEELDCTMGEEWSFWGGAKCATENAREGLGSFFKGALDSINTESAPPCNTSAIPCGPPSISIIGGDGAGALGNPIISTLGSILGIDFVSGGTGYNSSTSIFAIDTCGTGGGASIVPVISSGTITDAIVLDPGTGYLSAPDGSLGGNETTWANNDDTIVQRSDGTYDTPYSPGSVVEVYPGDTVQYPGEPPTEITEADTITAPAYEGADSQRGPDPSSSNGSYPVVLSIGDVFISNSGVNYSDADKITITPDNGAILEPQYDEQGRLIDVSVIDGGIGFTEFPTITIESTQGFNAQIIPVFKIIRIGDLPEDQDIVPPGTSIINVVDCVGRFK